VKPTRILLFAFSASAGIAWGVERSAAVRLRAEVARLHEQDTVRNALIREHSRLLGLQASGNEAIPAGGTVAAQDGGSEGKGQPEARPMRYGVWAKASELRNRGTASPEAAVETALWSASGGDLEALKATLYYPEDALSRAAALLARLPEGSRRPYATPEDLLAAVFAGSGPLDGAQLVTRQQVNPNEMTEYVRVKDSEGRSRQVFLALHKLPGGWRLAVPANTLDQITPDPGTASAP
jgi:hypothetical protein